MDSIQYSSSEDELPPEPEMKDSSKDRSSSGRSDNRNTSSSSSRRYTPEKRRSSPDRRSPDSRRYAPRDRRHSPSDSRRSPYSRRRSSDSSRRSREGDNRHSAKKKYRSERGSSHRKERDRDRRSRSRSRTPLRRSHHRDHGSPPRRRSEEKSPAPHPPQPPIKKPFDPQRKMLLLDKMGIDYKGTEEDQQSSGPSHTISSPATTTTTTTTALAAPPTLVPTTTVSTIPGLIQPLVLNTTRYEEQINKRKLLWNSKKTAPGNPNNSSNTSIWQGAKFSQDQDGKLAAKFQRLMGMKEPVSGSTANADSKGRDLIKKQEELFSTMEMQYEVARATTHTQRGVGLGFGPRHIP